MDKLDKVMFFVKPVLAVMLMLCLWHLPYAYYTAMRIVAVVAFAVMAYQYYIRGNGGLTITFVVLIFVFQPLWKIPLSREAWSVIDLGVALLLFYLLGKEWDRRHV